MQGKTSAESQRLSQLQDLVERKGKAWCELIYLAVAGSAESEKMEARKTMEPVFLVGRAGIPVVVLRLYSPAPAGLGWEYGVESA